MSRRYIIQPAAFIGLAAASFVYQEPSRPVDAAARPRVRAVAFDYFVLFDPNSVVPAAEALGIHPDGMSRDLRGLLESVHSGAPARPS